MRMYKAQMLSIWPAINATVIIEKLIYKFKIQEQNFHKKKGKLLFTFSWEYVLYFVKQRLCIWEIDESKMWRSMRERNFVSFMGWRCRKVFIFYFLFINDTKCFLKVVCFTFIQTMNEICPSKKKKKKTMYGIL